MCIRCLGMCYISGALRLSRQASPEQNDAAPRWLITHICSITETRFSDIDNTGAQATCSYSLRPSIRRDILVYFWHSGQNMIHIYCLVVGIFASVIEEVLLLQIFMHLRHYTRPVFQVRQTHTLWMPALAHLL